VTRRPGWVVGATLVLTLVAITRLVDLETGAPRLLLDPSVDGMLPAEAEARRFYDRMRELFGSDETLLVALAGEEVFTPDALRRIARIQERVAGLEGVDRVESLASALELWSGDAPDEAGRRRPVPEDPAALERLRSEVLANPLQAGTLVARDGRASALIVHLENLSEQEFTERGIDQAIEAIAEAERGAAEVWLTGSARIKAEITRHLIEDLRLVIPVAVLVMAGVALTALRTLRGVFVPLSTIGIAALLTLAVMADSAGSLNQVTVAVPSLLVVVGFAYAVHVVTAYYDELRRGSLRPAADALAHVALPVILTGITTAAGFGSLAASPLSAIRQFGVYTALGVTLTTIVSLTYAPAVLALLPPPRRIRERREGGRFDRLAEGLAGFDRRHRAKILGSGAVVAGFSLFAMTDIRVSTDWVLDFAPESDVRHDFEAVNDAFDGANAFSVVLEAAYRDAFKVPENLAIVDDLQSWLLAHPEIGGSASLVDVLRLARRGGAPDDGFDASRSEVEALVEALPEGALDRFVDPPFETANIVIRTRAIESGGVVRLVREIEDHLATLPRNLIPTVTGNLVLVSRTADEIALGQALSLSTAFVIIYAILALLFTSFRFGLVALVPNALPVLVYFGALGATGITLNTTTGLVAPLVLGIAVDDTIHYMARFHAAAKRHADARMGAVEALRTVGRPVTYTTIALCLGFLSLTLSQLQTQVQFGALAAFTLAFAWLVDVTLTPALAARMQVVTLWDVLTLDLGPDPQRAIPLFAGLRKTQARIVALLAVVQHIHQGHQLMRVGSEGDAMYVVIDGELEVSVPRDGETLTLRTVRRGDTVGEEALFHGRRFADVHILSDARLIRLTHEDLEQLRKRFPRIGAQVYRNLSRILNDQLAARTRLVGSPPSAATTPSAGWGGKL
jgi:predicted RND superfamily exporter protein